MTVEDLIVYLQKLPKSAQVGVVFHMYSDYQILDARVRATVDTSGELVMVEAARNEWGRYIGSIWQLSNKTWEGVCIETGRTIRAPTYVDIMRLMRDEARLSPSYYNSFIAYENWCRMVDSMTVKEYLAWDKEQNK